MSRKPGPGRYRGRQRKAPRQPAAPTTSPAPCDPRPAQASRRPRSITRGTARRRAWVWPSPAPRRARSSRSFTIKSNPNPESNRRDNTNCLNFFCVELFIPVASFSTSTINAGSSPNRCPISSASMPIRKPPALTRLFRAFIACPEPTRPGTQHRAAHRGQHRHHAIHDRRIPAHHDRELAGPGARHTARDRRIHHLAAHRLDALGDRLRERRHARTHLDHDGSRPHAGEHRVRAGRHHLFDDGAGREHRDHHVRRRGKRANAAGCHGAELPRERFRYRLAAIVDLERKTGAHEASRHGPAHVAETHETDAGLIGHR